MKYRSQFHFRKIRKSYKKLINLSLNKDYLYNEVKNLCVCMYVCMSVYMAKKIEIWGHLGFKRALNLVCEDPDRVVKWGSLEDFKLFRNSYKNIPLKSFKKKEKNFT